MIKVRLLTNGGYEAMEKVSLGTIFNADDSSSPGLVLISRQDLISAGADGDSFTVSSLAFFIGSEVEIVENA